MMKYIRKMMEAYKNNKNFHAPSISLEVNCIYSYDTLLAVIDKKTMHLNTTRYSRTTSAQQSDLIRIATEYGLKIKEYTGDKLASWHFRKICRRGILSVR